MVAGNGNSLYFTKTESIRCHTSRFQSATRAWLHFFFQNAFLSFKLWYASSTLQLTWHIDELLVWMKIAIHGSNTPTCHSVKEHLLPQPMAISNLHFHLSRDVSQLDSPHSFTVLTPVRLVSTPTAPIWIKTPLVCITAAFATATLPAPRTVAAGYLAVHDIWAGALASMADPRGTPRC